MRAAYPEHPTVARVFRGLLRISGVPCPNAACCNERGKFHGVRILNAWDTALVTISVLVGLMAVQHPAISVTGQVRISSMIEIIFDDGAYSSSNKDRQKISDVPSPQH